MKATIPIRVLHDSIRTILLALSTVAFALPLPVSSAAADNREIGVVVMHGKYGTPSRYVDYLGSALESKGFLVVTPEMPWSGRRNYDRSSEDAISEMDSHVSGLRDKGARQIVVIGHSLGAAWGLLYVSRKKVDAFVAISPGHTPESSVFGKVTGESVQEAKELVAGGKGEEFGRFRDINMGQVLSVAASARIYLSYFDPDGPMRFGRNVESVFPGTQVLWVEPRGESERLRRLMIKMYERLPKEVGATLLEPNADHLGAPSAAQGEITAWIERTLAGKSASGTVK